MSLDGVKRRNIMSSLVPPSYIPGPGTAMRQAGSIKGRLCCHLRSSALFSHDDGRFSKGRCVRLGGRYDLLTDKSAENEEGGRREVVDGKNGRDDGDVGGWIAQLNTSPDYG